MSDYNSTNTFPRHTLQDHRHWWRRIIPSNIHHYHRRRQYCVFGCVCGIAIVAISMPLLLTAIATKTTTTTTYHPTDDATATTVGINNADIIQSKNGAHVIINQNQDHIAQDRFIHNRRDNNKTSKVDQVVNPADNIEEAPHNYGVLLTHYHKTGYVLSRHFMQLVIDLEYASHDGMTSPSLQKNAQSAQGKKSIQKIQKINHFVTNKGVQIAFGQRGNWITSFVPARRHSAITGCPPFFTLDVGAMHVQESPDLFCDDEELIRLLFGIGGVGGVSWKESLSQHYHFNRTSRSNYVPSSSRNSSIGTAGGGPGQNDAVGGSSTGVKIVHFVRNPFEMALSNYLYHSQEPTPEDWVHIDDPCEASYNSSGKKSLASFALPLLSSRTSITSEQLDAVVAMCHSLYQSNSTSSMSNSYYLENATFYEHLIKLNRGDGLRLATAQMVISSSSANGHLAGGDILRMGHNVLKFENLRALLSSTSTSTVIPHREMNMMAGKRKFHLLTLSMEEYMASVKNTTLQFLDFVLGDNGHDNSAAIVPKGLRVKAAEDFENRTVHSKKGEHVTLGKYDDRDELIQSLRDDSILGPVLSEIEILVEEALRKSEVRVMLSLGM